MTVSDYIRDQVLAVGNDNATTILNSVAVNKDAGRDGHRPARTELGLPQDAFVVGMVARLDVYKGQLDLIHAFRQSALPETARLVIVGGGAIESTLRAAAGDDARIHFLGRRDDVPMILRHSMPLLIQARQTLAPWPCSKRVRPGSRWLPIATGVRPKW